MPNRDRNETTSRRQLWTLSPMTLNPHPIYPIAGGYVLRLHRDACPAAGRLMGRIEHVVSGESTDFASGEQLLDWLAQHAIRVLTGHDPHGETP